MYELAKTDGLKQDALLDLRLQHTQTIVSLCQFRLWYVWHGVAMEGCVVLGWRLSFYRSFRDGHDISQKAAVLFYFVLFNVTFQINCLVVNLHSLDAVIL
ncbi:hypothetical protein CC77DRAFT_729889 [Alternaria alternata]|jgi:hypothetical protein|uniref:Uncharacterized protein n=1 Tax=Alternaria alternata TaxID=5599 RepID=A0A177DSE1_ALTAL|nr:hypothetical protein CC77DRAFT_729889 [Alternaria alternata]OAG22437.1 hypothetical protein CC77DRAFT_729889 [Alternaria alternata]